MEKGNLIIRMTDQAHGIVISTNGDEAEVLFGDGLREVTDVSELAQIPFKYNSGIIASFPELIDAYIACRGFE